MGGIVRGIEIARSLVRQLQCENKKTAQNQKRDTLRLRSRHLNRFMETINF